MKSNIILMVGMIMLGLISCDKENNNGYRSNGKITGPDFRMCVCCGGWIIQIDSITYEFDALPNNSNINLEKDTFPILVKLDWELSNKTACPDKRITIQRIIKE